MIRIALGAIALGASILSMIRMRKTPLADIPTEEEIYAGGPVGPGAPGGFGGGYGPVGLSPGGPPSPAMPGGPGGQGPFTATPGPATGISIYPPIKPGQKVPVAIYNTPAPGYW